MKEFFKNINYKFVGICAAAVLAIILLSIFIVQGSCNGAISRELAIEESRSDIDVNIDRKINLLTELAECVKQYNQHEYNTLMAVINQRTAGDDVSATDIVNEIKVTAEAYPELKSQENYTKLMDNISETENLLMQHKKAYNSAVKEYKRYVRSFPARIFLKQGGYSVVEYDLYSTTNTDQSMNLF